MNCSWFNWGLGFNWYWLQYFSGIVFFGILAFLLVKLVRTQNRPVQRTSNKRLAAESCPSCGAPVEPEFIRCPECHYKLKTNFPNCNKIVKTNWKICPFCEAKLTE